MAATYKFVVGGVTKDLITDYGLNKVRQILGAGMPPVTPVITPYALTDGAYYQRRIVEPRIISLVCVAQGASLTALHTIRKTTINDIRRESDMMHRAVALGNSGVVGLEGFEFWGLERRLLREEPAAFLAAVSPSKPIKVITFPRFFVHSSPQSGSVA